MHLRCYRLAAGGSVNRVHLGTGNAEGRVRYATLKKFDYVIEAMEHEQCSTYSKTVSSVSSCCADTFQKTNPVKLFCEFSVSPCFCTPASPSTSICHTSSLHYDVLAWADAIKPRLTI